jgi:hypothetical protein
VPCFVCVHTLNSWLRNRLPSSFTIIMLMRSALTLFLLLGLASSALCLPEYFASKYANGCEDHPERAYGDHGAPQIDRCAAVVVRLPKQKVVLAVTACVFVCELCRRTVCSSRGRIV